jgi:hypothetical protein
MRVINSFVRPEEQALADEFAANGYVVRPVDDREALDELRRFVAQAERVVPMEKLNEYLSQDERRAVVPAELFRFGRSIIETLVGNELAMQNRVNLSIQPPEDESSAAESWSSGRCRSIATGQSRCSFCRGRSPIPCMRVSPGMKARTSTRSTTRERHDLVQCTLWQHSGLLANYRHRGIINPEPETCSGHELPLHRAVHAVYRRREEARFLPSADHHAAGDAHGAAIPRATRI